MKIVYCLYSLWGGGINRVTATKVNYWASKGHEVTILTTDYDNQGSFFPLDDRIEVIDFNLRYCDDFNCSLWQRFSRTITKMWKHYKLMKVFIREKHPDVIVTTHLVITGFLPFIKDKSIKIQELHSSFYLYRYLRPIKKHTLRWFLVRFYEIRNSLLMKSFDAVVSLTEKDKSLRGRPKNMEVIHNPIHIEKKGKATLESKNVLALGRYTEEKDFSSLLDIWTMVVKSCSNWHLTIAGQGYLKKELEQKIKDLKIESFVTLLNEQKDVQSLYLNSSIYVMTSRFEGFGMVLAEAQHFGIPSISYDCLCGPSDIITDGKDGFLIKPNDKETFVKRLIQLMRNEDLRKQMGTKAKEASKRFDVETIMPQWKILFNKLIKEKNGK